MVTSASSYGEVSSVICVNLGDWFRPNVHFVQSDGCTGINRKGFWSVGIRLGIGFGGADALPSLVKMALDGFVGGGKVLGGISVG